jgi:pimeloyl-ACP methyl ester carboxylesterase
LFLDVNGARIHYVQAGEGPDLVLLHGIGASIYIWRFLFPILQTRHRVTAFDLPGFGRSCKEAHRNYGLDEQTRLIDQAISELDLKHPLVIGSSMGGAIALWLAKLFPQKYPQLVTIAPATDPSRIPSYSSKIRHASPYLRHALGKRTMKLILSYVMARKELITDDTIESYLAPFSDDGSGIRAFWSATALLSDPRLPKELQDIDARVLVIFGENDRMVMRQSINELMKNLNHAHLTTHPEGGHHLMEDEPIWLAREIEKFLASVKDKAGQESRN